MDVDGKVSGYGSVVLWCCVVSWGSVMMEWEVVGEE